MYSYSGWQKVLMFPVSRCHVPFQGISHFIPLTFLDTIF